MKNIQLVARRKITASVKESVLGTASGGMSSRATESGTMEHHVIYAPQSNEVPSDEATFFMLMRYPPPLP
ncbi:MAG: hypothetical protein Q7R91_02135 [bacterium]|nr:hypothetical protein [bacterium]